VPAQTVLVGYDGSDAARRALAWAAELARGGRVVVLTATASVYSGNYDVPDPQGERRGQALLEEASAMLTKEGIEAETRMPVGDAADGIVAAADEVRADVIVVGRRRDSLARRLLGSVSAKVVEHAPCDVLVVR
jgi:nucleotide-binding universal stress UspA family protein